MVDSGKRLRLTARLRAPGDKSISHRAAMLGALAEGETIIDNFAPGRDCAATLNCLRMLGARVSADAGPDYGPGRIRIRGAGLRGLTEPQDILDCRNSGTTMRLLAGILAGHGFASVLTGDASLRNRPMARVVDPLRRMGATIDGRDGGQKAPLFIRGGGPGGAGLRPLREYAIQVASAQVKSCLMFAGMYACGSSTIVEAVPTRDHTERMMSLFGAPVRTECGRIAVEGFPHLSGQRLQVPGDISSAAFWLAAGAILPGSDVEVQGVGLNPLRSGFLSALQRMGCPVEMTNVRDDWEPVGDVRVLGSDLKAIEIAPEEVPLLVDEVPALAVCAAVADGKTVIRGAGELRHKESDRISAIVRNLREMGAAAGELPDGFWVEGGRSLRGTLIKTHGDHRIAMAFAIASLVASGDTVLDDPACIDVSYPGFLTQLRGLTEGRAC